MSKRLTPKQRREQEAQFQAWIDDANKAGRAAAEAHTPTPMVVQRHMNMMDDSSPVEESWVIKDGVCGFAWVNVKPATSPFAYYMKKATHARSDDYYGGVTLWVREYGQSMERKMAYAEAYAKSLRERGIKAFASSRMD